MAELRDRLSRLSEAGLRISESLDLQGDGAGAVRSRRPGRLRRTQSGAGRSPGTAHNQMPAEPSANGGRVVTCEHLLLHRARTRATGMPEGDSRTEGTAGDYG